MKVLRSKRLTIEDIEVNLKRNAKFKGVLKKKAVDCFIDYKVILRPFRQIIIHLQSINSDECKKAHTLIDEELSPFVKDENHRMLLWRPAYVGLETVEYKGDANMIKYDMSDFETQKVVDDMIEKRSECQHLDEEYQPKLRRLQADPLFAFSMIIPRRSISLKQEQELVDERKESHAYILASSIVANCKPGDIMTSSTLTERFLVETIVAYYETPEKLQRVLILETPNADSFETATKHGNALMRLCSLYSKCSERVTSIDISGL